MRETWSVDGWWILPSSWDKVFCALLGLVVDLWLGGVEHEECGRIKPGNWASFFGGGWWRWNFMNLLDTRLRGDCGSSWIPPILNIALLTWFSKTAEVPSCCWFTRIYSFPSQRPCCNKSSWPTMMPSRRPHRCRAFGCPAACMLPGVPFKAHLMRTIRWTGSREWKASRRCRECRIFLKASRAWPLVVSLIRAWSRPRCPEVYKV